MSSAEMSKSADRSLELAQKRFSEVALKFLNHLPRRLYGRPLIPMEEDHRLNPLTPPCPDIVIFGQEETAHFFRAHATIPLVSAAYENTGDFFQSVLRRNGVLTENRTVFRLSYRKENEARRLPFFKKNNYLNLAIVDIERDRAIMVSDKINNSFGVHCIDKHTVTRLFQSNKSGEQQFLNQTGGFVADLARFLIEDYEVAMERKSAELRLSHSSSFQ